MRLAEREVNDEEQEITVGPGFCISNDGDAESSIHDDVAKVVGKVAAGSPLNGIHPLRISRAKPVTGNQDDRNYSSSLFHRRRSYSVNCNTHHLRVANICTVRERIFQ